MGHVWCYLKRSEREISKSPNRPLHVTRRLHCTVSCVIFIYNVSHRFLAQDQEYLLRTYQLTATTDRDGSVNAVCAAGARRPQPGSNSTQQGHSAFIHSRFSQASGAGHSGQRTGDSARADEATAHGPWARPTPRVQRPAHTETLHY